MPPPGTPHGNRRPDTPRPPTVVTRPPQPPLVARSPKGFEEGHRQDNPPLRPRSPSRPNHQGSTNNERALPPHPTLLQEPPPTLTSRLATFLVLAAAATRDNAVLTDDLLRRTSIETSELVEQWRAAASLRLSLLGHPVEEFRAREGQAWHSLSSLAKLAKKTLEAKGEERRVLEADLRWELSLLGGLMGGFAEGRVGELDALLAGEDLNDLEEEEEEEEEGGLTPDEIAEMLTHDDSTRVSVHPSPARRPFVVKVREPRSMFFTGAERGLEEMLALEARRVDLRQGPERRAVVVEVGKAQARGRRDGRDLSGAESVVRGGKMERRMALEGLERERARERGGLR